MKRRIDNEYPAGINPGDEAVVVAQARDIIKKEITDQVPEYSKVMQPYEEATRLERELQRALSLSDKASADTALRKLQSVMRNNVNANFGNRLKLAERLEQAGDYLLPRIAAITELADSSRTASCDRCWNRGQRYDESRHTCSITFVFTQGDG